MHDKLGEISKSVERDMNWKKNTVFKEMEVFR